jgi:phosphonate transport system permease protein
VVLGLALAFFAIRVPDLPEPPRPAPLWSRVGLTMGRSGARLILGGLRAVPEIVWAFILVRLIGLGPGAAVLAIGLTVGGNIGKLYAELAEAVDPRSIQAWRAMGASRWAIFVHAILPQVRRQWTGYALFCLECNIRIGTILGVVGAGGLGSEIALSLRYFEYDKLATALLAVLVFVVALEMLSSRLRQWRLRWTLTLAALGTAWSLQALDIPWAELWTSQAPPLLTLDNLALDLPFVRMVGSQVSETLLMAWVATVLSAVLAGLLAPLAASRLMTGSYLPDPPRPDLLTRLWHQAVKWGSRAVLQGMGGRWAAGRHPGHRGAQHRGHGPAVCRCAGRGRARPARRAAIARRRPSGHFPVRRVAAGARAPGRLFAVPLRGQCARHRHGGFRGRGWHR